MEATRLYNNDLAQRRDDADVADVGCRPGSRSHTNQPYGNGKIIRMKKTLHIDEHLLREARTASGAKTDTDTVKLGLEALVRQAAYHRLRALRGKEPRASDVPRRRGANAARKHPAA
jgi:Arc/MetJ family transcription regulator